MQTARWVYLLLFLVSGATGLVYELVWTRQLVFVFGGTTYAISTVLTAFMGGLGLGSYLAGRVGDRLEHPGRSYGILEVLIGVYALLVPALLAVADPLYELLYARVADTPVLLTAARFLTGALVLLIPTTLMGATLPLLVRYITLRGGSFGASVAVLYGINSLGAVVGVVATGFVLIPNLGLHGTTLLAATGNILIGVLAWVLLKTPRRTPIEEKKQAAASPALQLPSGTRTAVMIVFALSGFAAMIYQVSWTRALVLSIGSSTYSFTCILAAFILGLSLGSFCIAGVVERWQRPDRAIGWIQIVIGIAALLILPSYGRLPRFVFALVKGDLGYTNILAIEFALIIAVTLIPTFLLGMMFPLVTRTLVAGANDRAAATGRAYGINTIGTILGSFLAGFVLMSSIGVQYSIVLASVLNGLSGAALLVRGVASGRRLPVLLALAALLGIGFLTGIRDRWNPLEFSAAAFQGRTAPAEWAADNVLLYYNDDVDLTVIVGHQTDNPDSPFLAVNGKIDASAELNDLTTELLIAHVPALLAPNLTDTCIIGLGSGITVGALACHDEVQRIDCAEISQAVIDGAGYFSAFAYDVLNREPRLNMIRADGRNHLKLTRQRYDLIISQPSNPWIAGVSNLFTVEFFELCQARLKPQGVVCVWMQGYSMSLSDFRLLVRTVQRVFPYVTLWEMNDNDYGLIAFSEEQEIPAQRVIERFVQPRVRADMYRLALGRPEKVLGRYLCGGEVLRAWAKGSDVHTDDAAQLEFSAPAHLYADQGYQILDSILAVRRPISDVVQFDFARPGHQQLLAQTERVAGGRVKRLQAYRLAFEGRLDDCLQLLVSAYRDDPLGVATYLRLRHHHERLSEDPRRYAQAPRARQILSQFGRILPPVLARTQGEPLAAFAQRLKGIIAPLEERQDWLAAESYLLELHSIAPDDPEVVARLARAVVAGGAIEQAGAILAGALERGVNPNALRKEPAMQTVLERPEIAELFEEVDE